MQEYRDTQTEINQLTDVQLPTLELADVKSLAFQGWQQTKAGYIFLKFFCNIRNVCFKSISV